MPDPKEGIAPEDNTEEDTEGTEPNEPEAPQPTVDPMEDIEPPERKPSEIERYKQDLQTQKEKNRVEFQLRKLSEENQKLRKEMGLEPEKEPSSFQPQPEDNSQNQLISELTKRERISELKDFVSSNEKYKDLEKPLMKFVNHPAYQNVPVDFIAKALIADKAERLGAEKVLKSQKEAKMSQPGGHPLTPRESKPVDYSAMPKEEFEKKLAEVKRQQRS